MHVVRCQYHLFTINQINIICFHCLINWFFFRDLLYVRLVEKINPWISDNFLIHLLFSVSLIAENVMDGFFL